MTNRELANLMQTVRIGLRLNPGDVALQRLGYAVAEAGQFTRWLLFLARLEHLCDDVAEKLRNQSNLVVRAAAWQHPGTPIDQVRAMLSTERSDLVRAAVVAHPDLTAAERRALITPMSVPVAPVVASNAGMFDDETVLEALKLSWEFESRGRYNAADRAAFGELTGSPRVAALVAYRDDIALPARIRAACGLGGDAAQLLLEEFAGHRDAIWLKSQEIEYAEEALVRFMHTVTVTPHGFRAARHLLMVIKPGATLAAFDKREAVVCAPPAERVLTYRWEEVVTYLDSLADDQDRRAAAAAALFGPWRNRAYHEAVFETFVPYLGDVTEADLLELVAPYASSAPPARWMLRYPGVLVAVASGDAGSMLDVLGWPELAGDGAQNQALRANLVRAYLGTKEMNPTILAELTARGWISDAQLDVLPELFDAEEVVLLHDSVWNILSAAGLKATALSSRVAGLLGTSPDETRLLVEAYAAAAAGSSEPLGPVIDAVKAAVRS